MGSGSSQEDISEGSGVKNDALQDYNEAMATIAMHSQRGKIQPLTFQLTTTWDESKPEEKELCIEKATEACSVVCSVIAPKDGEKLFQAIQLPAPAEHVGPTDDLIALMSAYHDASTKNLKTQILSSSIVKGGSVTALFLGDLFPVFKPLTYETFFTHW